MKQKSIKETEDYKYEDFLKDLPGLLDSATPPKSKAEVEASFGRDSEEDDDEDFEVDDTRYVSRGNSFKKFLNKSNLNR